MHRYEFRAFERTDLPMIARWLRAPENVRWWGDPDTEFASLAEDLDEPKMRQWIVACDGRDFAYAQAYAIDAWPQTHLSHLPSGTVAIDVFVGEPDMLGRGHGGAFLRRLAQLIVSEGAPLVAIDPNADNHRARRAYSRAGFFGDEVVEDGDTPVVVMTFAEQPELETMRLRLEPLHTGHASRMFNALQDERLYTFIPNRPPKTLAALQERYRKLASRISPDADERWLNWILVSRSEPNELLGYAQATVRGSSASVAYVLFPSAQGRGFAVEAVGAVIDYLATCDVVDVHATIDKRNARSVRVVETLGFERIATAMGKADEPTATDDCTYAKALSAPAATPLAR